MKHSIVPKNVLEVDLLQATSSFLAKFTKTFISDLSGHFFRDPKITFHDPIWGRDP